MVTGRKLMQVGTQSPRLVNPVWALVTLLAACGGVAWVVSR
jgi:hypothetical protein